jgi:hypothetical protein
MKRLLLAICVAALFFGCEKSNPTGSTGDSIKGTFANGIYTNSKYGLSFNYDTSSFWLCAPKDSLFASGSIHGADLGTMFYTANGIGLISIITMWPFSTHLSGTDLNHANQVGLNNSTYLSSDTTKFNGYPTARTYYSYTAPAGAMKGCMASFFFGGVVYIFDCDCNINGFDAFNSMLTEIWNTIALSSGTIMNTLSKSTAGPGSGETSSLSEVIKKISADNKKNIGHN